MNGFNSAIPSTLFSTFMRCILAGIGLIWTVLSNPADDIKAGQEQGFQSYLKEAWDRIPSVQMSERVCRCVYNQLPGLPSLFGAREISAMARGHTH
jgi:hypothetical protein